MRCDGCGEKTDALYGDRCFSCTRTPYRYPHHGVKADEHRCPKESRNALGDMIRCVLLKGHGAMCEWTCPAFVPRELMPETPLVRCALKYGHPGTWHITHGGEVAWEYDGHWRYDAEANCEAGPVDDPVRRPR